MDFGLTEQQKLIRDGAHDYLRHVCTGAYVRQMVTHPIGCSEQVWRELAGMGWTGLIVPGDYGGIGLGLVDLALVVEEMGAVAFPGPFFSTAVIGASAIAGSGGEHHRKRLLPRIADGSLLIALAAQHESGAWPFSRPALTAFRGRDGWELNGAASFVADAGSSHAFVVAAGITAEGGRATKPSGAGAAGARAAGNIVLGVIDRTATGLKIGDRLDSVGGDRLARVALDRVVLDDAAVLGSTEDGRAQLTRLFRVGAALKAVEIVGGARRVLELIVDYARRREQFGRPIGSFQAVQHMVAEIAIQAESARLLAYQAVWRLDNGADASAEVALAKLRANDAAVLASELAHQSFGAIGFTQEHDLQLFTRRALAGRVTYGDDADHRDAALAEMGLQV